MQVHHQTTSKTPSQVGLISTLEIMPVACGLEFVFKTIHYFRFSSLIRAFNWSSMAKVILLPADTHFRMR